MATLSSMRAAMLAVTTAVRQVQGPPRWARSIGSERIIDGEAEEAGRSSLADAEEDESPTVTLTRHRGIDVVYDPFTNRGTGFSREERERLGIRGLVPPAEQPLESQIDRVMTTLDALGHASSDTAACALEQYAFLSQLNDRNATLFFRVLVEHIERLAPIVYTPTVGAACLRAHAMYRRTRGMWLSLADRGSLASMMHNWPEPEVDVIVVTDGSRVLGLGDLGVSSMPIPIGKLQLYVAAGGIDPRRTLPVVLDTGTNNVPLRTHPLYLGLRRPRATGREYEAFVNEFMAAVHARWPRALVQFEDFANPHAAQLLARFRRSRLPMFNDDIQSTGCVALAAVLAALRARQLQAAFGSRVDDEADGTSASSDSDAKDDDDAADAADAAARGDTEHRAQLSAVELEADDDHAWWADVGSEMRVALAQLPAERVVCVGAGSAGIGVCDAIARAVAASQRHAPRQAAADARADGRGNFWLTDERGLLGAGRAEQALLTGQRPYVREDMPDGLPLLEVVRRVKPTVLIGLAGVGGVFTREVLSEVAAHCVRPVIMPLSNPSSRAECSAQLAFEATNGRALFASGSPFPDVHFPGGATGRTSMCNNAYNFPGVGLAVTACRIAHVTDAMFAAAAVRIASLTPRRAAAHGRLFPPVSQLRAVSLQVAIAVARVALRQRLTRCPPPAAVSLRRHIARAMWHPTYAPLVPRS